MTGGGSGMALAEWIDARLADVDADLASRVRDALASVLGGADAAPTVRDAAAVLLRAATARLAPLATDGCIARDSAVELLAVDALVTLACEALADACDDTECILDGTTAMVRGIAATMPELDGAA